MAAVAVVELPLGEAFAAAAFSLEKAVCSHGFFMMAPNYWDPKTRTLQRPLRLSQNVDDPDHQTSVTVRICQPSRSSHSLQVQVFGNDPLSSQQEQSLLNQVRRMLRLSEEDNKIVRDFQEIHPVAKEREFGRLFRSPTLFEDMIKCVLLCNCQWSRTLSMARALCELQWELQQTLSNASATNPDNGSNTNAQTADNKYMVPNTPAVKETKRKLRVQKCAVNLANRFSEVSGVPEEVSEHEHVTDCSSEGEGPKFSEVTEPYSQHGIGNFPSPKELASVNVSLLAKRCNLGYRASRILKLAQLVDQGVIQLRELEEACRTPTASNYDKLAEQLKKIDGFGPFTCANVLMCMGFYHVIPSDSETIRHLKQVHSRNSSIKTLNGDLDTIYRKYAPFQFLAYWSEVLHFYEEWFGKMSDMASTDYKLITAANMKPKKKARSKGTKTSQAENQLEERSSAV